MTQEELARTVVPTGLVAEALLVPVFRSESKTYTYIYTNCLCHAIALVGLVAPHGKTRLEQRQDIRKLFLFRFLAAESAHRNLHGRFSKERQAFRTAKTKFLERAGGNSSSLGAASVNSSAGLSLASQSGAGGPSEGEGDDDGTEYSETAFLESLQLGDLSAEAVDRLRAQLEPRRG